MRSRRRLAFAFGLGVVLVATSVLLGWNRFDPTLSGARRLADAEQRLASLAVPSGYDESAWSGCAPDLRIRCFVSPLSVRQAAVRLAPVIGRAGSNVDCAVQARGRERCEVFGTLGGANISIVVWGPPSSGDPSVGGSAIAVIV